MLYQHSKTDQQDTTYTSDTSEYISNYAALLSAHAQLNGANSHQEKINAYIAEALKPLKVRRHEFSPFAPFRREYSALSTATFWQIIVIVLLLLGLGVALYFYGIKVFVALIAVTTIFYLGDMLFTFWLSLRALRVSSGEQISDEIVHALAGADWPDYTVLCPLYHEAAIVPQLVSALQSLDYPTDKLQILLLIQDDDIETYEVLKSTNLPAYFSIITLPAGEPRTKPRACNYGLLLATGEYVVVYDAEDIPDPLQLKKAILTFLKHGPDLACVQAKLNVYNGNQNPITRLFSADFYLWFDAILPGLQSLGLPIPLGGTSNHFRTEALRAVGAWDAFNVTEDCDLGLRLAHYQLKTAILDSTTYEEANSQVRNWFRQRTRWIKGFMQTYLVNMRRPQRYLRPRHWSQFISLQFVVGAKTGIFLVNPVMWVLLILYVLFRTTLDPLYHILFPTPILYAGMASLIFGNFFYIYSHIVCCLKRRQYGLIKWTLVFPVYWVMMSVGAYLALFDLIFKPHYWRKTQHGLHLRSPHSILFINKLTLINAPLKTIPEIEKDFPIQLESETDDPDKTLPLPPLGNGAQVTGVDDPDKTLPLPPLDKEEQLASSVAVRVSTERDLVDLRVHESVKRSAQQPMYKDPWLIALCIIACVASVVSLCYFFQNDQILVYKDAYSHLLLARRLIDSATPGFAQLGGVWLPLPHLLMQPFIWNDYLWHSGLAGSFVSMLCYLVTSVYLFLAARRITKDSRASFVGALLFVFNPNILYLQATPMSELVLIVTMTMACYHFLAWSQDDSTHHLILAALGTLLATLARYDGWFLFPAFLVAIVIIGLMKRQSRVEIEGKLLAFGILGGLGIVLWCLWCAMIFGDPLYFQRGPFSSQADQDFLRQVHILSTYHNLWQSTYTYLLASIENVGLVTSALAFLAFLVFIARRRFTPDIVAGLAITIPIVFYIVSLYTGQAAIFLSPINRIYNARYGVEAVIPAAFFVATLAGRLPSAAQRPLPHRSSTGQAMRHPVLAIGSGFVQLLFVGAITAQSVLMTSGGIISLLDGQYGADCAPHSNVVAYLAQHYTGGRILEDFFTSRKAGVDFTNIDFANIIYEGSGPLWKQALKNPASLVDWVIVNPRDQDDVVAQQVDIAGPKFLSQFIALVQEPQGLLLFHRKWLPLLPTQSVPASVFTEHAVCAASDPRHIRTLTANNVTRPAFETGLVFPRSGATAYGQDDTAWVNGIQEVQQQTGARWIEMPIPFFQASFTSTSVTGGSDTPTLTSFAQGIRTAHAQGYQVFVAPLIFADPLDTAITADHWSGHILFSTYQQNKQWFDSYWQTLKPYVEVAAQEGVEQFTIGTEDEWLERSAPNALWNTLIARMRTIFPGTITYDMNWTSVSNTPLPAWMHNPDLGLIGVSAYFPLTLSREPIDSKQMLDLWRVNEKNILDTLSVKLGKPVFLSEVGYRNSADAVYHTWEAFASAQPDPEEQAIACDAAMENIFNDPHIAGTFFWGWDNVSAFRLRGMPAVAVIHTWYTSLETE